MLFSYYGAIRSQERPLAEGLRTYGIKAAEIPLQGVEILLGAPLLDLLPPPTPPLKGSFYKEDGAISGVRGSAFYIVPPGVG